MTPTDRSPRPLGLAIFLIVGGAVAWFSAFQLTLDKFQVLADPNAVLGCNFSVVVQCGRNLSSAQGAAFGFPNPLLGVAGFVAPIAVGVGILAGARYARWFWFAFNIGIAGALAFVIWLIGQSIFVLGTLCPWCMVVWSVTIPMFLLVTLHNLRTGAIPAPERARSFFAAAYGWVPLITLGCYIVIAVLAQVQLNVVKYL
ncbi:MAG: vitamin epoxide reductase family protein [Glaciihabitans sp.]|nr:vitamin epoxide reductase family protein [Glaciihabitans sp.]